MTSTEITTIIAALGVVLVNVIVAWRTSAKVDQVQAVTEQHAKLADNKLDAIHDAANGNLTVIMRELTATNERIAKLLETAVGGMVGSAVGKDEPAVTKAKDAK